MKETLFWIIQVTTGPVIVRAIDRPEPTFAAGRSLQSRRKGITLKWRTVLDSARAEQPQHVRSLNHLISAQQQRLRNAHPERRGSFQVYRGLELRRLFDRKIDGLRAPQDLVDISSRA